MNIEDKNFIKVSDDSNQNKYGMPSSTGNRSYLHRIAAMDSISNFSSVVCLSYDNFGSIAKMLNPSWAFILFMPYKTIWVWYIGSIFQEWIQINFLTAVREETGVDMPFPPTDVGRVGIFPNSA